MKKKVFQISILLMFMFFTTSCEMTEQQEIKSMVLEAVNSPQVEAIRSMTTDQGVSLGDLIDAGVGSPTYELYDPAEDGNTYVTISGNITYNEIPVVLTIQYKKTVEENYEFYTLTLNDIPVKEYEVNQFFEYLYESYYESLSDMQNNNDASSNNNLVMSTSNNELIEGEAIKAYLPMEIVEYEFGEIYEFVGDFNNDGVSDTVRFYFEQVDFYVLFLDGKSEISYENYGVIPENMFDEDGNFLEDVIIELATVDLDFNGDLELLIAATNNTGISGLNIMDGVNDNMKVISNIEGQYEFVILDDAEIFVPIGSQGLGNSYKYSNGKVSELN